MSLNLSIKWLTPPELQFGGDLSYSDPKVGLSHAGPFDLNFGEARKKHIKVGIVGSQEMIDLTKMWISRCMEPILATGKTNLLYRSFPGFERTFHSTIVFDENWVARIDGEKGDELGSALAEGNPFRRFDKVLNVYTNALNNLAGLDSSRPDVVILAISSEVIRKAYKVEYDATKEGRKTTVSLNKTQLSEQASLFDLFEKDGQPERYFLKRNLHHALKARALKAKLPIQIITKGFLENALQGENVATQAWDFSVGIYYKSGGMPWRLPQSGPETCFVGISFYSFRTTQRYVIKSSLAQAFSSDGEGFAIRGGVLHEKEQGRNAHLSDEQAYNLTKSIITEYVNRTGGTPARVVMHKTNYFDDAELAGIDAALSDIPVVDLVALIPSALRLLRLGVQPPRVGTLCTVNNVQSFLFTSGFIPELGTYPGPHVPQPFEVHTQPQINKIDAAQDVLNLTRMHWNTADISNKWPVTLSFTDQTGGILDEFGKDGPGETSFRYFV